MWANGLAKCSWQKGNLLTVQISVSCNCRLVPWSASTSLRMIHVSLLTGLRFFLSSVSSVPALRAMISGAASGSWAIGEPHSGQKIRWTSKPEDPLLEYFLAGPLMVSFSLGTTVTRAAAG